MLYEIITVILALYVIASPIIIIKCIKFGYRMAVKPEDESKQPMIQRKTKPKEITLSKEEEAELAYWNNVVNFYGTAAGQKPIEV